MKMRYVLWVVALLEACDVTNNGRHLSRHLGFYQEVEIRLTARNGTFFSLTCKIAHKLAFCIILSTTFTFIVERNWNTRIFAQKCLNMRGRDKRTATENVTC